MPEELKHHISAHFSGRVQGVGFRFRTLQIAKEFDVSGFVKNLPDGRVQLEVEGDPDEVKHFVDEVADKLDVFIRKLERRERTGAVGYKGFTMA